MPFACSNLSVILVCPDFNIPGAVIKPITEPLTFTAPAIPQLNSKPLGINSSTAGLSPGSANPRCPSRLSKMTPDAFPAVLHANRPSALDPKNSRCASNKVGLNMMANAYTSVEVTFAPLMVSRVPALPFPARWYGKLVDGTNNRTLADALPAGPNANTAARHRPARQSPLILTCVMSFTLHYSFP